MNLPSIEGGFRCVLADPPWSFSDKGSRIAPEKCVDPYQTMSAADIAAMPVGEVAAKDALLFLWTTSAHMLDGSATHVARGWGFEPKATVAWVKCRARSPREIVRALEAGSGLSLWPVLQIGMGHYIRNAHEHLVICRRGRAKVLRKDVPSVIFAPRSRHSAKPEESYRMIESLCDGPRLELFARQERDGWTVFGNQIARAA